MTAQDNVYTTYQQLIKNKDTAVNSYITRFLAITQSMFEWRGLPETIPAKELERLLQTNGNCFVTNVYGKTYALSGVKGGEQDEYGRPTIYTVSNPCLQLNKNYTIHKDGVLIENDSSGTSLLPLLGKYAVLLTDAEISLNTAAILSRITMLISASDDKTKASADTFVEKILNGDFSVIGENAFFAGVKMQNAPLNANYITQLIELLQYYKASLYNEVGLNANYNMKRERLNLGETSMNVDILLPYVDNMLRERTTAAEAMNNKYGLSVEVELNSSWQLERENYYSLLASTKEAHNHPAAEDEDNGQTDNQQTGNPDINKKEDEI